MVRVRVSASRELAGCACVEFYERARRLGVGAWVLEALGAAPSAPTRAAARALDAASELMLAIACRFDHLRIAPELHPCAHGCDVEGHVLDRPTTLLLLDRTDTFLCPHDHVAYLADVCKQAKVRWRDGWHCGWMYGRLWLEAGKDLGDAIDTFCVAMLGALEGR